MTFGTEQTGNANQTTGRLRDARVGQWCMLSEHVCCIAAGGAELS
jgi:hypothetical protein